jgi:hypothetical protein
MKDKIVKTEITFSGGIPACDWYNIIALTGHKIGFMVYKMDDVLYKTVAVDYNAKLEPVLIGIITGFTRKMPTVEHRNQYGELVYLKSIIS